MRQVDKKFLEQQVKLALQENNKSNITEAPQVGVGAAVAIGGTAVAVGTAIAYNTLLDQWKEKKHAEIRALSGDPEDTSILINLLDFASTILIGSWEYGWKVAGRTIKQKTTYGFSPKSYITATLEDRNLAKLNYTRMDSFMLNFIKADTQLIDEGERFFNLSWKEEIFDDLTRVCNQYGKLISDQVNKGFKNLARVTYHEFFGDVLKVYEKHGIDGTSTKDRGFVHHVMQSLPGVDKESVSNTFTKPDSNWIRSEIERVIDNPPKDKGLLSWGPSWLESQICKSFRGVSGFESFNEIKCYNWDDSSIARVAAMASHVEFLRQSTTGVQVWLAFFDIVFSLLCTVLMFSPASLVGIGLKFVAFSTRALPVFKSVESMRRVLVAVAKKIDGPGGARFANFLLDLLANIGVTTVALGGSFDYKLAKLQRYHTLYCTLKSQSSYDEEAWSDWFSEASDVKILFNLLSLAFGATIDKFFKDSEEKSNISPGQAEFEAVGDEEEQQKEKLKKILQNVISDEAKKANLLNALLEGGKGKTAVEGIIPVYRFLLENQFSFAEDVSENLKNFERISLTAEESRPTRKSSQETVEKQITRIRAAYKDQNDLNCADSEEYLIYFINFNKAIKKQISLIEKNKNKTTALSANHQQAIQKVKRNADEATNNFKKQLQQAAPCVEPKERGEEEPVTQTAASPAIDGDQTFSRMLGKYTDAKDVSDKLEGDDIIVIGDSNAAPFARKRYRDKFKKKPKSRKDPKFNYIVQHTDEEGNIIEPTFPGAGTEYILNKTKEFFNSKGEDYAPKLAIIHMGYNDTSSDTAFANIQKTVMFLKSKNVQDVRIIDVKAGAPASSKMISLMKNLSRKIRNLDGVTIILNDSPVTKNDGFHFQKPHLLYSNALKGVAVSGAEPEEEEVVQDDPVKLEYAGSRTIEQDMKKAGVNPTPEDIETINKIYETAIKKFWFIRDKKEYDAFRHTLGKLESGNRFFLGLKDGRLDPNLYTGRYGIGPAAYIEARKTIKSVDADLFSKMKDYGVPNPNPTASKWEGTWNDKEALNRDPISQEIFLIGHTANKVRSVPKEISSMPKVLGMIGISHNVGSGTADKWHKLRKQFARTKDESLLYKMWSLQDGFGTPGENFFREMNIKLGGQIKRLPKGWHWGKGANKGSFSQNNLKELEKFDKELHKYVIEVASKKVGDQRIFAFQEKDMAERLWKWCTSGLNFYKKDPKNKTAHKDIKKYYDVRGYPIGMVSSKLQKSSTGNTVDKPQESDSIDPQEDEATDSTITFPKKDLGPPADNPGISEDRLNKRIKNIQEDEDFYELANTTDILYGVQRNNILTSLSKLDTQVSRSRSENLENLRDRKFKRLISIHRGNNRKFFKTYKEVSEKEGEEFANQLMAFLHRPRIITELSVNRLLYTDTNTYTLSFEMGPPYGSKVGVINQSYTFFGTQHYGESEYKKNLSRILRQNRMTFEALKKKLESFSTGELSAAANLGEEYRDYYLKYYSNFIFLLKNAEKALEDSGSAIRRAAAFEYLQAAVYLLG